LAEFDALAFVLDAVDKIARLSYYTDRVDWPATRARVTATIEPDAGVDVAYRELRSILALIGDGHSFVMTPDKGARHFSSGDGIAHVERDPGGFGYVRLDGFFGRDRAIADRFAADVARRIDEMGDDVAGWIVDLRHNPGGNMWPMLAGLASLVGTNALGSFVYRDGTSFPWNVEDYVTVPVVRDFRSSPVAVLIGPTTASSGEAVALAFVGCANACLVGEPTKGLSSSNDDVTLRDGGLLFLTTSVFADRTGRLYGVPIEPDQPVAGQEAARDAARRWLASRATDVGARGR
jgi:C-terminal processing protease CtpA/Prc